MKLSEIRPCDNCGQKIAPAFWVLRISQAIFTRATNQVLSLAQMFQGSVTLAEVFAPDPEVVVVMGDENKELQTELFICSNCFMEKPLDLALLYDKRNDADT